MDNIATELKQEVLAQADIIADLEAQTIAQARTIQEQAVIIREHQAADVLAVEAIRSLTAQLAQCKHALDDEVEMCECGHSMSEHKTTQFMTMGCFHHNEFDVYCECLEFRKAAKDACECGHSLDSHTKSGVHPCGECGCLMFWAKVTK